MKITMAHGSGGKDSAELMKNIFGRYFSNEILDRMEDAAVLDIKGRTACSTDTFVVTPLVFPGGDIGKLSVCGTVNDLLMMGAEPEYITCGFVMEEGLDIDVLERITASLASAAKDAGVSVIAGDTKVIEGHGGLFINTTGLGRIPEGRSISASGCRPGDKIILSGDLGDHHACILSARMDIGNDICSDCACLSEVTGALFDAGITVRTMRDVTRGGLATVLNEVASTSGTGMKIYEKDIPVNLEVRGFCDILGLDPLYMGNEGKLIAAVPGEEAQKALEAVRKTAKGRDAAVIGEVVQGKGVSLVTDLGGIRVLDVLYGEGLPRIC